MKIKYLIIIIVLDLIKCYSCNQCKNSVQLINEYVQDLRDDFPKYVINPQLQHGRHKRSIDHTLEENGLHTNEIILSYQHHDTDVIIDLWLNEHLIPEGHYITYQTKNGEKVVQNLTKTEVDLCQYHGSIRGKNKSRVALSTCNGINGLIFDEHTTYYIQSGPESKINSEHFLYTHKDTKSNARCGNTDTASQHLFSETSEFQMKESFRYKRAASTSDSSLRLPYNSNKDSLYVELLVVVENLIFKNYKSNIQNVHAYVKDLVNIVNSLYVPLNIFIALTGVVVWNEQNEMEIFVDGDKTLSNFVKYRKANLIDVYPNDNAHLLVKNRFECSIVGIAYEGQICTTTYSGGVTTMHSPLVGVVATTMAHELGHNFGLKHDDPIYCQCVDKGCIMYNSTSSVSPKHWSSCSLDQLSISINKGITHCLKNKPTKLFGSNSCGNGFVETGEQCDCGLPKHCSNVCCNPKTCMFNTNATCASGICCDLNTCQLLNAGHECRTVKQECDLSEHCDGKSENCPKDVFKRDTESCDNGQGFCYEGLCRSHLNQCKLLWGLSGKPGYQCFEYNKIGSNTGNCGFNRQTKMYVSCNEEDIYCGLLHCRQLSDQLQYGNEKQSIIRERYVKTKNSPTMTCRTVIINVGRNSRDPGLTPHGAKCGENKMCFNEKCISLEVLRATGVGSSCPENCNGNGICNSQGNCHCSLGYAPPTCSKFGFGGSIDSGPISNDQETSRISIIFIIILLLITSCIAFGLVYWYQNKSVPNPNGLARKLSQAPREMIEIIRKASTPTVEIARRVSGAPREIARRVSNVFANTTYLQAARSNLRRTGGPHAVSSSRELILDVGHL